MAKILKHQQMVSLFYPSICEKTIVLKTEINKTYLIKTKKNEYYVGGNTTISISNDKIYVIHSTYIYVNKLVDFRKRYEWDSYEQNNHPQSIFDKENLCNFLTQRDATNFTKTLGNLYSNYLKESNCYESFKDFAKEGRFTDKYKYPCILQNKDILRPNEKLVWVESSDENLIYIHTKYTAKYSFYKNFLQLFCQ